MVGIYKVTSPSGKVYIGQSWNLENRFKYYKSYNAKGQHGLNNSFNKYGANNHKFEIIHELPEDVEQEVLDRYEQLYMDQYKECGIILLNCREAGSRGKFSEESKQKMKASASKKREPLSKEHKQKLSIAHKGKKLSEETKNKLRKINIGKEYKESTKQKQRLKRIKRIFQFTKNNIFVKEWISIREASRQLKINAGNISNCASNVSKYHQAGGFIWKYVK